jgi:hypothetical protein
LILLFFERTAKDFNINKNIKGVNFMENNFAEGYAIGRDTNNNNGWGGFGYGGDWLWIIVLFALFGNGWGNGFGGGNGGVGSNYILATDFATIERKIDGVNQGLCDGFYAMNTGMLNGFSGVQQTLCQGFSGINASITDVGYAIKDCCCATQRAIDGVNYNMAKNTCDIIQANTNNTQRVIDFLTNEKICSLQSENAGLKAQISNDRQSAYLLSELKPCPVPAYLTCNPNAPYGLGYGVNPNGCGCN